jgi:hypothetical protein
MLVSRQERPGPLLTLTEAEWATLRAAATVLFWLTVAGYVAFVISGARNGVTPQMALGALLAQKNDSGDIKEMVGGIVGITTLTQVGPAFVVVSTLLITNRPDAWLRRARVIVIFLAIPRAFLLAERLALIEVLVPLGVVLALHGARSSSERTRAAVRLAPLVMLPALLVVFGAFEYSRSWAFFSTRTNRSFLEFTALRLNGYYATSYNNGQLSLTYMRNRSGLPFESVSGFWAAPGIEQAAGGALEQEHAQRWNDVLTLHGTLELNSPGGLVVPFLDYGIVGGLVVFFAAGGVIGLTYRWCVAGRLPAVLLYPVITTGLFELPRFFFWTTGRATPAFVALGATAIAVRRSPRTVHSGNAVEMAGR